MSATLPKNHLDLMLLAIISGGPRHGYAIIEELRARSGGTFDLPEGTVYPALHRLERAGLLASEWSSGGGRRRRTYRVTRDGRSALGEQHAAWWAFVGAVNDVIGTRPLPGTT